MSSLRVVKLFTFLKCLVYLLFKVKIKSFPKPPNNITHIGFLDGGLMIHVKKEYMQYFNYHENISTDGSYTPYKKDQVQIVFIKDKVLIEKRFKGSLKKRVKFYNELRCLIKLSHLKNVPKIYYIDYNNLTIYLQFIEGDCLRIITETERKYPELITELVKNRCELILEKIHDNNIAIIDVWSHNIIYNPNEQDVFFIDFEDSICHTLICSKFLKFLQKEDKIKMTKEVLIKL